MTSSLLPENIVWLIPLAHNRNSAEGKLRAWWARYLIIIYLVWSVAVTDWSPKSGTRDRPSKKLWIIGENFCIQHTISFYHFLPSFVTGLHKHGQLSADVTMWPSISAPSSSLWCTFVAVFYSVIFFHPQWCTLWQTWLLKALYK